MELRLTPALDAALDAAVCAAASKAGLVPTSPAGRESVWWRAGLEDATEGPPALLGAVADYVGAPSRRSTRGATRA